MNDYWYFTVRIHEQVAVTDNSHTIVLDQIDLYADCFYKIKKGHWISHDIRGNIKTLSNLDVLMFTQDDMSKVQELK